MVSAIGIWIFPRRPTKRWWNSYRKPSCCGGLVRLPTPRWAVCVMDRLAGPEEREIEILLGSLTLKGILSLPQGATGLVLFVHGSGSSRFSSRNRYVAQTIDTANLATLLFDLLSQDEEKIDQITAELRLDIGLLTERVIRVTSWLRQNNDTKALTIGYFGASTGAAAALAAAAEVDKIGAVVSRGGRPDLVEELLPQVTAPTLLIVGGNDDGAIVSANDQKGGG